MAMSQTLILVLFLALLQTAIATTTMAPTGQPSGTPTRQPTVQPSETPTRQPTNKPSRQPSTQPTGSPTRQPSSMPTNPTGSPTAPPTSAPSYTKEAWGQILTDKKRHRMGGLCDNHCSNHGTCQMNSNCLCFTGISGEPEWTGPDCSLKTCPKVRLASSRGIDVQTRRHVYSVFIAAFSAVCLIHLTRNPSPFNQNRNLLTFASPLPSPHLPPPPSPSPPGLRLGWPGAGGQQRALVGGVLQQGRMRPQDGLVRLLPRLRRSGLPAHIVPQQLQ